MSGAPKDSSVAVKVKKTIEGSPGRHYDQDAYMKSKDKEKTKKAREEKDTCRKEREQRLKDLQERQRQIVIGNLMCQKRQRDDLDLADHDHLDDIPSDESRQCSSYSSPLLHSVPYSTPYPTSYRHTTPVTTHIPNSAPPERTTVTHTPTPGVGVVTSLGMGVPSLSSSPPQRTSPLSFISPPVSTSLAAQPQSHSPDPIPTPSYLSSYAVNCSNPTALTTSVTRPLYSPVRGSAFSPSRSPVKSPRQTLVADEHQARLLELKQSAIALREKIIAQKQVLATRGVYASPRSTPSVAIETKSPPELPGVNNIHEHVASVRARQEQEQAAVKIQSMWKGYRERNRIATKPVITQSVIKEDSEVNKKERLNLSPLSGVGDASFSDFMSRMLSQYVKEEEMRAKHQAALLELREKAIKEKTEMQLELLKLKKGKVQKQLGDDKAIQLLPKQEKGILKKMRHEQAEIQRLKEAHIAASHNRKLLLIQQQDISRIHRSAHYYRDKISRSSLKSTSEGNADRREESPIEPVGEELWKEPLGEEQVGEESESDDGGMDKVDRREGEEQSTDHLFQDSCHAMPLSHPNHLIDQGSDNVTQPTDQPIASPLDLTHQAIHSPVITKTTPTAQPTPVGTSLPRATPSLLGLESSLGTGCSETEGVPHFYQPS